MRYKCSTILNKPKTCCLWQSQMYTHTHFVDEHRHLHVPIKNIYTCYHKFTTHKYLHQQMHTGNVLFIFGLISWFPCLIGSIINKTSTSVTRLFHRVMVWKNNILNQNKFIYTPHISTKHIQGCLQTTAGVFTNCSSSLIKEPLDITVSYYLLRFDI